MESRNFTFKAVDETEISVYRWQPDDKNKIKAVIQVVHGMGDNAGRYKEFAENLVKEGFAVYADDHRGHGKTVDSPENLGHFADKNGWALVIEDLHKLADIIKKENPRKKIFMFGHSMGSFLVRDYTISYGNEINGIILSGTGTIPSLMGNLGIMLARWEIKSKGVRGKSPLLLAMTFGSYNKHFKPNRTPADWITRDNNKLDQALANPYWIEEFSSTFFFDLLSGLRKISIFKNIQKTPKDLPIYLLSGTKDPVGNFTKGVLKVFNDYKKAGIKDLNYKFYNGARHEIINEINNEEVYRDIITWLNDHL